MNRRRFLRNVLVGASAFAVAPSLLRAQHSRAGSAETFAAGLRKHPWLAGWKNVGVESFGPTPARIEGRLPKELAGTLYRNGPAWYERAGIRYQHWFDGDGMLHAWHLGANGASHQARMVATTKFQREQRAGHFVVPAAGTTIAHAQSIRNNDDMNTANTSVLCLGERVFALWEGGSAIELSADDLATIGPVSWREDLGAAPFSAHPLRDRDGSIWNFGSLDMLGGSGLLIWHLDGRGRLQKIATLKDAQHGYLHSFAMTERHLVFVLTPYRTVEGKAFFERLRFAEDLPCRIAVVAKDALEAPRWFDVDFGMVYHFADAFERGREIIVRAARHGDASAARSPHAAAMHGNAEVANDPVEFVELRIDLASGRARWVETGIQGAEFPTFDARAFDPRRSRIYASVRVTPALAPYANAVASIDVNRERLSLHRYGDTIMAEEHVFVAKPGSRRPGQGWLVGTLLDPIRGRSGLAVLDAEHVDAGPLATAWLPYAFPLGFHGAFSQRT
jgi:all-trans-8'-apo-beta-carotenal 15,15'-oxygenase